MPKKKDPPEGIKASTKFVHEALKAMAPQFAACYGAEEDFVAWFELEYDEAGVVYYVESKRKEDRKMAVYDCMEKILRNTKFNIDLKSEVRNYKGRQRFGYVYMGYDPKTQKVSLITTRPIGTDVMVWEKGYRAARKGRISPYDKAHHYYNAYKRRLAAQRDAE